MAEQWAQRLIADGIASRDQVEALEREVRERLAALHREVRERAAGQRRGGADGAQGTGDFPLDRSPSPTFATAVQAARLALLNEQMLALPDRFTVHPKLAVQLRRRREALAPGTDRGIEWTHAEALALASLLADGTPVRLTGQDVERGAFSQRHLVLHDATNGRAFCPLQQLPAATAVAELHNSPLSEIACLAFEYGYSAGAPEALVLWEAQFGDFANSAQVVIDQFLVSGLAKWGSTTSLTLLLPHGYEGSGPDHSSGRLERFLQLAAEGNVRIASPSTPAQYFHLLRRQAMLPKRRPLIVMTPKSLLRLPQATSRAEQLTAGSFRPVLAEPGIDADRVRRLLLCAGKVAYDLIHDERRAGADEVAVGRVELLYPFPEREIRELIAGYPALEEVVWVQEEPRNMGARAHMSPRLQQILPERLRFGSISRPDRASTGEGYPVAHARQQRRIVEAALDLAQPVSQFPQTSPADR